MAIHWEVITTEPMIVQTRSGTHFLCYQILSRSNIFFSSTALRGFIKRKFSEKLYLPYLP